MRDFADKFDINVSVTTIHQIITNKILTFKKFVHDGCPHCCLRMKNRGGFLHSASFYDDGRKKVTRFLAELSPRMRPGYLILTRKPNNNQACGRGKGPRHRRKPEYKIGRKTHVYHVHGHERNDIDACRTEWTDCQR